MSGNSLNLVDMVKGYMTSDFSSKVSSLVGESRDRTQMGIDASVPGILSTLDNSASTTDGARLLASAVDSADDGLLTNIGSMFGRTTGFSAGILETVLGSVALSRLSGSIGRTSGLSGKTITTLLGVVAPIIFGVLKKVKLAKGLDSLGLSNLLAGQRTNIAAAMPEGMRMGEAYREPLREVTEETYRPRAETRTPTVETYSAAPEEPRKSSLGWILPLALFAGLLGLIWHWSTRPGVRAGRDDDKVAEQTARLKGEMGRASSLEALTVKYNDVIQEARAQGVNISSITQENGMLIIRGTAPSMEAINRVNDQIRRINPNMNDAAAYLVVESSQAPSTASDESASKAADNTITRSKPSMPSMNHPYTVKRGDTLGTISKEFYGTSKDYMRIYNENKSGLKDANTLEVGQTLEIPLK